MQTVFELWLLVPTLVIYVLFKGTGRWFLGADGERYEKGMRGLHAWLKILAALFVCWGLYLIVGVNSSSDRLERFALAGYGMVQFGFATFLFLLPNIEWMRFLKAVFRRV